MDTYYSWRNTSFQEPQYWDEYSWSYEPEPEPRESLQNVAGQYNALSQAVEETSWDLVRSSEETLAATERLSHRLDDILQILFKTPEEPRIDHVHIITTRCDDEVAVPPPQLEPIRARDPFRDLRNDYWWNDDEDDIHPERCTYQSEPIQTEIDMAVPCQDKMAVPSTHAPIEETHANDTSLSFPSWYDGWFSDDDEDDFEPEMAIPSPHVDVSDDEDMYLEDLFGDSTREEDEMAIPSPKEDIIEDPIEAEIQAFLNAKEDGELIPDEWQDPEEVLKELEKLLYEDHRMCEKRDVHVPEEKSLDGLQTMPPPRQTGKFSNFHISEFPVCNKLVPLGLNSFLHLHNKLGLRNWKITKKKIVFINVLSFCLVVLFTLPLAKTRNKFGKGNFDVPFDNG